MHYSYTLLRNVSQSNENPPTLYTSEQKQLHQSPRFSLKARSSPGEDFLSLDILLEEAWLYIASQTKLHVISICSSSLLLHYLWMEFVKPYNNLTRSYCHTASLYRQTLHWSMWFLAFKDFHHLENRHICNMAILRCSPSYWADITCKPIYLDLIWSEEALPHPQECLIPFSFSFTPILPVSYRVNPQNDGSSLYMWEDRFLAMVMDALHMRLESWASKGKWCLCCSSNL